MEGGVQSQAGQWRTKTSTQSKIIRLFLAPSQEFQCTYVCSSWFPETLHDVCIHPGEQNHLKILRPIASQESMSIADMLVNDNRWFVFLDINNLLLSSTLCHFPSWIWTISFTSFGVPQDHFSPCFLLLKMNTWLLLLAICLWWGNILKYQIFQCYKNHNI